jgi:hypothetical protein
MPAIILSDNGVSSGSAGLKTSGSNDGILALQTSTAGGTATTAVTINTSQNVGIGTTSPAGKLGVNGFSVFGNQASTGTGGTFRIIPFGGDVYFQTGQNTSSGSSSNLIFTNMEASAEFMRLNASGNLGLGVTPAAWGSGYKALQINNGGLVTTNSGNFTGVVANAYFDGANYRYTSTAAATLYRQNAGAHDWSIAGSGTAGNAISFTQAMTLDSSGNVGIGTTTPLIYGTFARQFTVQGSTGYTNISVAGGDGGGIDFGTATIRQAGIYSLAGSALGFYTNAANSGLALSERARITAAGVLLVGVSATGAGGSHLIQAGAGVNALQCQNNSSTLPYGPYFNFSAATPNNSVFYFLACADTVTRYVLYSNGGVANYQANNVNLSDRREKTNFAPAGNYLAKICAIPVQTFNYIDQNTEEDDGLTLGVVAQDVQAVAPELVMESNWANKDEEPKMRLSIYQTDLQYALMKSIQELKAIVDAQAAEIAALKGTP